MENSNPNPNALLLSLTPHISHLPSWVHRDIMRELIDIPWSLSRVPSHQI